MKFFRDRNLDRGDITSPGIGIQTVDGKAEQLDFQRRSFESGQSGGWIFVFLPDNARRSDIDQVRAPQASDYVRVERRFLDRERFELGDFSPGQSLAALPAALFAPITGEATMFLRNSAILILSGRSLALVRGIVLVVVGAKKSWFDYGV